MTAATTRPVAFTIHPALRVPIAAGGIALSAVGALAVARGLAGLAPTYPYMREAAVAVHLASVLPALPLGLWLLLARKGDARHRALGRIWMLMMLTAAISAVFIRHLNQGSFSLIHLFVPLTIYTIVLSVMAARAGNIAAHKAHLVRLYAIGLLVPGAFAFLPGRMMSLWLLG
ncbi:DUF2306 domain-containing protein [Sphingomonas canadensis]|uniref:DUF2306 domain-containing protein n=1 Tax=Sphingomonas canadensis TaxID=1219257 RepID=A0ABW3H0J4_9SPHN|nr:DUF2306 domain-containing protein [Sphingomonas canadensis]MCW3835161.1 DUF2306 domain-containing protein [Sphingomonas canadensis]